MSRRRKSARHRNGTWDPSVPLRSGADSLAVPAGNPFADPINDDAAGAGCVGGMDDSLGAASPAAGGTGGARGGEDAAGRGRSRSRNRAVVSSDIPGDASAAITDAFDPKLYAKRRKLEEAERHQKQRKGDDGDDGSNSGPPQCLINAARVLCCPVCSDRITGECEAHDDGSSQGDMYNHDDDSQFLLDDSQRFEDTEAQIRKEDEAADRRRRREAMRQRQRPHLRNLGRKSLLIAPSCGHVFCTDCWEGEREGEVREGRGGSNKVPCPVCADHLPTSSVGKLRVRGEGDVIGPMSGMGAVLLRGMMLNSACVGEGDGKGDMARRGAGELVPGTHWKKLGRKRKSDAYMDMSGIGLDAGVDASTATATGATNEVASSELEPKRRSVAVEASLLPIKEESQSQAHSDHEEMVGSKPRDDVDVAKEQPSPPAAHEVGDAAADTGENTQMLDLDLFRSIAGGCRGDNAEKEDGETGIEAAVDSDATAAPASTSSSTSNTKGNSSVASKKRKTPPSASSAALGGLVHPKGSRTIDPGNAKRGGRVKRRRTGGGLNMRKNKEEQRRREEAKAAESDLSFHGTQSQLSAGTAGNASSEKNGSARNDLSFGSHSSSSASQADQIPAKDSAPSSASARVSASTDIIAVKNKKSLSANEVAVADPDNDMTTPASNRKHKHSIYEAYEEVDDEIIEFTAASGKVEKRRIDRSHEIIAAGTLVRVANRTFPGSNKLGGVAKVKASRGSVEDNTLVYDVAYVVLGGRDNNIPYVYVVRGDAFSDDDSSRSTPGKTPGSQRRSTRASRSSASKPSPSTRSSPRRRSPRIRQDGTSDINPAPQYAEVEEHDDDDGDEAVAQPDDAQGDRCEQQPRVDEDGTADTGRSDRDDEESDDETKVDGDPDLTASQVGSQESPALLPSEPSPDRPPAETTSAPAQLRLDMSAGGKTEVENHSEIVDDDMEEEDSQTQLPPQLQDSDETAQPNQNENDAEDDEDYDDSQTQAAHYIDTNGQVEEPSESPIENAAGAMTAKRSVSTKTPVGTDLRCVAETIRATDKAKREDPASPIAGAARNLDSKFVAIGERGITWKDGDNDRQDAAKVNDDDCSIGSEDTEEVPATEMQQYSPDLLKETPGSSQQRMEVDEHLDSPSQVPATETQLSPALLENRESPGRGELDDDSCTEVPATEPPPPSQGSPESLSQQSQTFDFSTAAAGNNDEGPSTPSRPKQHLPTRGNHYSPSQESLHSQNPHGNGRELSEPSEMYFLPSQAPSQAPTNQSAVDPAASPDRSQGSVDATGPCSPASPESPEDSLERHLHYLAHGTQTESQTEPSQHRPSQARYSSLKKPVSDRKGLRVEFDMTAKQSTAKKSAMGNPDTPATGYSTTTEASTVLIDNTGHDNDPLPETEEVPATEPPPGYYESQVQRDRTELRVDDESQFPGDGTEEIPATLPPPGYEESQVQRDRSELRVEEGQHDSEAYDSDTDEEVPSSVPQNSRYSSSMPMADSEFASLARKAKEGLAKIGQPKPMKLRRVSEAGPSVPEGNVGDETDDEEGLQCELRLPSKENVLVPGTSGCHTTQTSRPLLVFNAKSLTKEELNAALRLQDDLDLCDITSVYGNYNDLNPRPKMSLFVVHTRALSVAEGAGTPDEILVCERSFEYIMALASGSLVVSADWLVNSSQESRWIDPKPFVVWGDCRSYLLMTAQAPSPDWLEKSFNGGVCRKAPILRGLIDRKSAALPLLSCYAVALVADDNSQSRPDKDSDELDLTVKQLGQLISVHGGNVVKTGQEQCWKVPSSSTKRIVLVPNSLERDADAISAYLTSWLLKQSSIAPDTAQVELDQSSEIVEEACSTQQSLTCNGVNTVLIIRARWVEDSAASLRSIAPLKDYYLGRICWEG